MSELLPEALLSSPYAWISAILLLVLVVRTTSQRRRLYFPLVPKEKYVSAEGAILEGLAKYPGKPFTVRLAHHDSTIIPPKFMTEFSSIPEHRLSFYAEVKNKFLGEYTWVGLVEHDFADAIRIDLTRHLQKAIDTMQEELPIVIDESIGDVKEWTPFPLYNVLLIIVARIAGRVFVPIELSRNPEWIGLLCSFTQTCFAGSVELWKYPKWTHPIVARFLPQIRAIGTAQKQAVRLLTPILEERKKNLKENPNWQPPEDMITWIIKRSNGKAWDPYWQAMNQMEIGMASMHTTCMSITYTFHELLSRPQYIPILREEWKNVEKEEAGKMTKQAMYKLKKHDSFLKETQRHNPPSIVSMGRMVMEPITLSDGTILPKGICVASPAHAVNTDPRLWGDAEVFDPWRFEKLRASGSSDASQNSGKGGNDSKWQYVTTHTDSLNFGYGIHACPGRFFASNEIKLILGELLARYEIKFPDGVTRPPNGMVGELDVCPDFTTMVLFRNRKSE